MAMWVCMNLRYFEEGEGETEVISATINQKNKTEDDDVNIAGEREGDMDID